jgi:nucleoside-diphosphate-sugar epimerase
MAAHVIVGKGAVGSTLAQELVSQGHEVLVVSRTGGAGPGHVALDATDAAALTRVVQGADVLYNCANPKYTRWTTDWPPLAAALLEAAARTGAVLVTAGNLYGYGTHGEVVTEETPLRATDAKGRVRAQMWRDAVARTDVRTTEIRGGDYVGPLADAAAHAGPRFVRPIVEGKVTRTVVAVDQPHSWTYLPDFARALAAAGRTPDAWGRAWHVPTAEPLTFRALGALFAEAAGAPTPRIKPMSAGTLRALGLVSPLLREIGDVAHHFSEPLVMDTTASSRMLGQTATPWSQAIAETLGTGTRV